MKIKKEKKITWGLYFPLKDGKPIQFSHQLLIKLHFTVRAHFAGALRAPAGLTLPWQPPRTLLPCPQPRAPCQHLGLSAPAPVTPQPAPSLCLALFPGWAPWRHVVALSPVLSPAPPPSVPDWNPWMYPGSGSPPRPVRGCRWTPTALAVGDSARWRGHSRCGAHRRALLLSATLPAAL